MNESRIIIAWISGDDEYGTAVRRCIDRDGQEWAKQGNYGAWTAAGPPVPASDGTDGTP